MRQLKTDLDVTRRWGGCHLRAIGTGWIRAFSHQLSSHGLVQIPAVGAAEWVMNSSLVAGAAEPLGARSANLTLVRCPRQRTSSIA
jgi:hypothetical protein